ncbi:MAG: DOMON-like domain-containing protein [Candidatus Binatia bacterium]
MSSYTVVLTPHPETYREVVYGIEARVCWTESGALALTYALKGDITRLRLPPPRPPRRADRLWQHTCFESFVAVKGEPAYHEFNFAPSGEWAAYKFQRYRDGTPLEEEKIAAGITVRIAGDTLELGALIRLHGVTGLQRRGQLRLGLSAVVEDDQGMLSYWALKHPAGKPDFHHPDAFALELGPPTLQAANELPVEKR